MPGPNEDGDAPTDAPTDATPGLTNPRTWPGYEYLQAARVSARLPWRMLRLGLMKLAGLAFWVGVPLVSAMLLVRAMPYETRVDGIQFRVQGSILEWSGVSADTTLGSWEFPHVTGLPVGVHVTASNVDLVALSRSANGDMASYVAQLRQDFSDEFPVIGLWLIGEALLGVLIGLALVIAVQLAIRQLRGAQRRPDELRMRARQFAAGIAVVVLAGAYGALTFESNWARQSRLTGTLAALQLFPDQLQQYYNQQTKAADALSAIIAIQAGLQQRIGGATNESTAYNIMYISDVHLAAVYPLVAQYARNFDVKLIVNTGDETEFGSTAELSVSYVSAISDLTKTVPMLWIAGNHDSPAVAEAMASIPGVTVLGTKERTGDGAIAVSGTQVTAGGLTFAGIPDPRVYGGSGAYGSDDKSVVDKLERQAMDAAVKVVSDESRFDVVMTHEPVAAKEIAAKLSGQIRQLNSGHLHAQNSGGDVQSGSLFDLVEGSTGAGGLDNLSKANRPPIEFSIETVADDCQFTKVSRFQIEGDPATTSTSVGSDVIVSTIYLNPQKIETGRTCSTPVAVGPPEPLS